MNYRKKKNVIKNATNKKPFIYQNTTEVKCSFLFIPELLSL